MCEVGYACGSVYWFIVNSHLLQVVLLSATMAPDVLAVTRKFMRDPVTILVRKEQLTLEGETGRHAGMWETCVGHSKKQFVECACGFSNIKNQII